MLRLLKQSASFPAAEENRRKGMTKTAPAFAIMAALLSTPSRSIRENIIRSLKTLSLSAPKNWAIFK